MKEKSQHVADIIATVKKNILVCCGHQFRLNSRKHPERWIAADNYNRDAVAKIPNLGLDLIPEGIVTTCRSSTGELQPVGAGGERQFGDGD